MRYFLDMNIPIYFCMQLGHELEKKSKLFVKNKGSAQFILCEYILKVNLPKWLKRQRVILFEFNQKIQNQKYVLFSSEQSKELFPQDRILAKRLTLMYDDSKDKEKFISDTNQIFNLLHARIKYFIKNYIDEAVIPESEIDFELKSCLFTWLTPNDSDAKTIASAVQENKNNVLVIMTSDRKHWTEELLNEIHNNPKLVKKYPSLPEIEYLQDYQ